MKRFLSSLVLIALLLRSCSSMCENGGDGHASDPVSSEAYSVQLTEYSVTVNGVPCESMMVLFDEGTYALPLVQVYGLIGSEIKTDGSEISILLQLKDLSTGEELRLSRDSDLVLNERGDDMLFIPVGDDEKFIHTWINNDLYVSQGTLFSTMFFTTDWYFIIHTKSRSIEIKAR